MKISKTFALVHPDIESIVVAVHDIQEVAIHGTSEFARLHVHGTLRLDSGPCYAALGPRYFRAWENIWIHLDL